MSPLNRRPGSPGNKLLRTLGVAILSTSCILASRQGDSEGTEVEISPHGSLISVSHGTNSSGSANNASATSAAATATGSDKKDSANGKAEPPPPPPLAVPQLTHRGPPPTIPAPTHKAAPGVSEAFKVGDKVLKPGDQVKIKDIKNKPELNGQMGTLLAFNATSRRWQVQLFDAPKREIAFREDNLLRMPKEIDVTVMIHGLVNDKALNGQTGTIVGPLDSGRFRVKLFNDEIKEVKPANLRVWDRDFKTGDQVEIKGIKANPELNGKKGTLGVFGKGADENRWQVQLPDKRLGDFKLLREDNLQHVLKAEDTKLVPRNKQAPPPATPTKVAPEAVKTVKKVPPPASAYIVFTKPGTGNTPDKDVTVTFKYRPFGINITAEAPFAVKQVTGQAKDLAVEPGWLFKSINGSKPADSYETLKAQLRLLRQALQAAPIKVGDKVVYWNPGNAAHGRKGTVTVEAQPNGGMLRMEDDDGTTWDAEPEHLKLQAGAADDESTAIVPASGAMQPAKTIRLEAGAFCGHSGDDSDRGSGRKTFSGEALGELDDCAFAVQADKECGDVFNFKVSEECRCVRKDSACYKLYRDGEAIHMIMQDSYSSSDDEKKKEQEDAAKKQFDTGVEKRWKEEGVPIYPQPRGTQAANYTLMFAAEVEAGRLFQVEVPPDALPGQVVNVKNHKGEMVHVEIPAGVKPGQVVVLPPSTELTTEVKADAVKELKAYELHVGAIDGFAVADPVCIKSKAGEETNAIEKIDESAAGSLLQQQQQPLALSSSSSSRSGAGDHHIKLIYPIKHAHGKDCQVHKLRDGDYKLQEFEKEHDAYVQFKKMTDQEAEGAKPVSAEEKAKVLANLAKEKAKMLGEKAKDQAKKEGWFGMKPDVDPRKGPGKKTPSNARPFADKLAMYKAEEDHDKMYQRNTKQKGPMSYTNQYGDTHGAQPQKSSGLKEKLSGWDSKVLLGACGCTAGVIVLGIVMCSICRAPTESWRD